MRVGFYFYIFYFLKLSMDAIKKLWVRAEFIFLFLESVYGFNQKIRGAGGNIFLQKRSFHTNIHTAGPSTIEAIWCGLRSHNY